MSQVVVIVVRVQRPSASKLGAAELPLWLARLHRQLPVDAAVTVLLEPHQIEELPLTTDELFTGAGFAAASRAATGSTSPERLEYEMRRLHTLPDWIGPGMRALVVGLNPSPASANDGVNFARPGNRFWPAALAAGLVTVDRDPEQTLAGNGVGFTDLVKRTTRTAAELTTDEFATGLHRLERLLRWLRPSACVVVGLTGWRAAANRKAVAGWQAETLGGTAVYLMPNTSGLNAHSSLDDFIDHFRAARAGPTGKIQPDTDPAE